MAVKVDEESGAKIHVIYTPVARGERKSCLSTGERIVRKLAAAIIVLLTAPSVCMASTIVIVRDGQAGAVIVTASEPTPSAERASRELQHFVERMSGAQLPIYAGVDAIPPETRVAPRLLVGRSAAVEQLDVEVPALDDLDHSREGFVLKTVASSLVIAGNETGPYRGTEYAVYELLERLGCGWFFPGPFGEVVPEKKTIAIPALDETQRPSFIMRNIWSDGLTAQPVGFSEWLTRNKGTVRRFFGFPSDGSIHRLVPPEKYAKVSPEIYAMGDDGQRRLGGVSHKVMICPSSAKLVEIAAEGICQYFRDNPEANSFGFNIPDNDRGCRCEECRARNHGFVIDTTHVESISDPYYNFVNNLAHAVNKVFPDRYIVILAYSRALLPPEGLDRPWNKNIIAMLARLRMSSTKPMDDPSDILSRRHLRTLKAWARICPKLMVYDYDSLADLTSMPFWTVSAIRENMRIYKAHNVIGFATEGMLISLRTGLNHYIRARLMWDAEADVDALLEDFYRKFFGPAAAPMRAFFEGIQGMMATSKDHVTFSHTYYDWTLIYPPAKVQALGVYLGSAEQLVDSETLKKRVRAFRALHDFMVTYLSVQDLRAGGRYAEALAAVDALAEPVRVADEIQPGLLPTLVEPYRQSKGVSRLRQDLIALTGRSGGEMGRRLALAPPEAQFRIDPHDEGYYEQWQREEVADTLKWNTISLRHDWTQQGYMDEQGRGYMGLAWYRYAVPIPALEDGERAYLYAPTGTRGQPAINSEELWCWVNGQLVWSPTDDSEGVDIDITPWVRPGEKNRFIWRMRGSYNRTQHSGIMARPLVWAAKK